jgi:hypothetical protein
LTEKRTFIQKKEPPFSWLGNEKSEKSPNRLSAGRTVAKGRLNRPPTGRTRL